MSQSDFLHNMKPSDVLFFYDGECAFCQSRVQWLMDRDKFSSIYYAPLQGETAEQLLSPLGSFSEELDTMVLLENVGQADQKLHTASTGVLRLAGKLPFPYSWAKVFLLIPRFLRDPLYFFVAKRRQSLAGAENCRLPDSKSAARVLP